MEAEGPYIDVYDGVVGCMSEQKGVPPNVDGITGAILLSLGFQPQHGTGLFLLARTAAMLAHVVEEQTDMPYQTQKRFMLLPVAMPKLFNANFKQLAKRFNKLRDNSSFQKIQGLFSSGAKKPFRDKEQQDQAIIDDARQARNAQPLESLSAAVKPAPANEDRFAATSELVEIRHPLDTADDSAEVPAEYFPELLAAASMCLATSLEQITPGENATDAPPNQRRAADLLNQALKLVHEAAALDVQTTG
jgi:hypothetical protein